MHNFSARNALKKEEVPCGTDAYQGCIVGGGVGRIRRSRHPVFWEYRGKVPLTRRTAFLADRGIIPLTRRLADTYTLSPVNGIRGATALPLSIPAAPREIGAAHCAHLPVISLRSAQLDVVSRFASGRHPWRPALAICPPARRFQRGQKPSLQPFCSLEETVSLAGIWGILRTYSVHHKTGRYLRCISRERDKGSYRAPLINPRGPAGNRCCALRSPPGHLSAVGSTRRRVSVRLWPPSLASSPCHLPSGSPISAGTQPRRFSLFVHRRERCRCREMPG